MEERKKRERRAITERIYRMGHERSLIEGRIRFKICGSSNKDYDVDLLYGDRMRCTCMDFKLRDTGRWKCKHILFVIRLLLLVKTIDLDTVTIEELWIRANQWIDQQDETRIFWRREDRIQETESLQKQFMASVIADHSSSSSSSSSSTTGATAAIPQRPYIGEDCPICCETLTETCTIWTCRTCCGKSTHSDCMNKWLERQSRCVWCNTTL